MRPPTGWGKGGDGDSLIPLTVPELLRVLRLAAAPPDRQAVGLHWSRWRRHHQAIARACHTARRARAQPPPPTRAAAIIPLAGVPPLDEGRLARVLAVLPPAAARGRPPVDARRVLGGIIWLMRHGGAWREIPTHFGPWATIASRYRLWQQDGTWTRIAVILTAEDSQLSL